MATMKHTKSPSGKTHRLTNRKGTSVTLRYTIRPAYDDQVQGDLIRKYRDETGDPTPIGRLGTFVDAALLDNGQQQPSLDYLRGYLEGLTSPLPNSKAIRETREQIAALEAAQAPLSAVQALATGTVTDRSLADDEPRFPRPPASGGAASIQINEVQPPRVNRLSEGVQQVKRAERNGW